MEQITENKELTYTYVGNIEIGLTDEDVESCAVPCSDNTSACEEVEGKDYINGQLSSYTDAELAEAVKSYAIENTESMTRKELYTYIVWLAAWDIKDDDGEE